MSRSRDNRSAAKSAVLALSAAVAVSGCVGIGPLEQKRLDELAAAQITCETPPDGFEAPNDPTTAALLNVLPGFGSFYLASGTAGRPSHYLWGTANFLLWPISIAWAAPEAYVDAGRINQLALVEYCEGNNGAGVSASQSAGLGARYEKWRAGRAATDMVESKSSDPKIAAIVNGVAVIPGEVYGYLADGVDKAMSNNAGREVYEAVKRDLDAGTDMASIRAALSAEDSAAASAYAKFVQQQDFAALEKNLAGIAGKLASDGRKIAGAVDQIKNLDSLKGKNPFALAAALKGPVGEIDAIKDQLADALKAVDFWRDLNRQDEELQTVVRKLSGKTAPPAARAPVDGKEAGKKPAAARPGRTRKKANPAKAEPEKAEPAPPEPAEAEPEKAEPAPPESAEVEPEKAEPAPPESAETEPEKDEPEAVPASDTADGDLDALLDQIGK